MLLYIILTLALLFALPTQSEAVPLIWTLNDITFEDGGIVSGTFTFDAESTLTFIPLDTWLISVSGGDETHFPAFVYEPGSSASAIVTPGSNIVFQTVLATGEKRELSLLPVTPLTDAGGTVSIDTTSIQSKELICTTCDIDRRVRFIASGFLTAPAVSPVPEPSTLLLLVSGLAGLALGRKRFIR